MCSNHHENEVLLSPLNLFHLVSFSLARIRLNQVDIIESVGEGVSIYSIDWMGCVSRHIRDKVRCHYIDHWLSCFDSRNSCISKVEVKSLLFVSLEIASAFINEWLKDFWLNFIKTISKELHLTVHERLECKLQKILLRCRKKFF